jgi:thymidylate synthase
MEFDDINAATKYFATALLESEGVKSTNAKNDDIPEYQYKKLLGGELPQQFFVIKDSTKVENTYPQHKAIGWWTAGEILSEFLGLNPPVMYDYRPDLYKQHYDVQDDGRIQYMYGTRWQEFNQLESVYQRLKENPNSKKAVITIFMPYDNDPARKDSPCTTMYHFLHRNGQLDMTVMMRSWDFFGGWKYDFKLSSFMLQSLASWLQMKPGKLAYYVTSLHYYARDEQLLRALVAEPEQPSKHFLLYRHDETQLSIADFHTNLRRVRDVERYAFMGGDERRGLEAAVNIKPDMLKSFAEEFVRKNEKVRLKKLEKLVA